MREATPATHAPTARTFTVSRRRLLLGKGLLRCKQSHQRQHYDQQQRCTDESHGWGKEHELTEQSTREWREGGAQQTDTSELR
jgi:hypothetical protein